MLRHRVIQRLIIYRRILQDWLADGRPRIYSHELAAQAGVTAAQVRRDIMAVDYAGSPARGYDAAELIERIGAMVDAPETEPIGLIGAGQLGQALMAHFNRHAGKLRIVAAFDTDPERVGRVRHGCRCYAADDLEEVVIKEHIHTAILAVPGEAAQAVTDRLLAVGISGILNFTPTHLHVPPHVYVENVDIGSLLEKVAYFARSHVDPKGVVQCAVNATTSPSAPA